MSFISQNTQSFQTPQQDQNFNPNRILLESHDDSRNLHIDRKYSLHDNVLDESNQSITFNNQQPYYGIGYGQNEEVFETNQVQFQSPEFVKKMTGTQRQVIQAQNRTPTSEDRKRLGLMNNSGVDDQEQEDDERRENSLNAQNYGYENRVQNFRSSKKSNSNQWALKNNYLTSTNIKQNLILIQINQKKDQKDSSIGGSNIHQEYLDGETLTGHHMRNPTNMRSQGNYASRPNSNLAVATQLANGTVSAGGFDHDIECEETDFKYLEEVISKVKEGTDQQFHLSDYLEAMLQENSLEQTEEWDAIVAEAKEIQKTLKKVLDISFFLLERTQMSSSENKGLGVLNTQLLKELQISRDQCNGLSTELRNSQNKIRQQYEAIKTQEDTIKSLNDQIQSHLDIIRKLEKSSILSNTQSFGYSHMNAGGPLNDEQQEIINQHIRKLNELETYLSEQTSNYHSEVYKNEKLMNKLKEYSRNEELLNIQIFQLETFKEEKDEKIFKLKEQKRLLKEELIRKDIEIKTLMRTREPGNQTTVKQGIVQLNRFSQSYLNITQNDNEQVNQSYTTSNVLDTTTIKHQRRGFNICGSQQKWSHELDVAVNRLRESKSGFLQRSFIVQQNIQEIQKAHHKRMQTISSNELRNSHQYSETNIDNKGISSPFQIKLNQSVAPRGNKILAYGSSSANKIFNTSGTEIKKLENSSPEYISSAQKPMSRFQHSEESKFDINDHISPRKSTVYSNFNEDDEDDEVDSHEKYDDVVELNSVKNNPRFGTTSKPNIIIHHHKEQSKASNFIGINESDLMEFNNTSNNQIGPTIINQSNFDYSYRLDDSQMSIKNNQGRPGANQNGTKNPGSSATTKETKQTQKMASSGQIDNKSLTVNNFNITQNIGINNYHGENQFVQSFKGSMTQEQQFQETQQKSNIPKRQIQNLDSKKRHQESEKQKDLKNAFDSQYSLHSYGSINRGSNKQNKVFEMQLNSNKIISSPNKKSQNLTGKANQSKKVDFFNEKVNQIQIGAKLSERDTVKNIYDELNCITIDQKELENDHINYHISQIEKEEHKSQIIQDITNNNIKFEEQISRIIMSKDILLEYFVISVLAFILKHPKRTTLQAIDKLKLYNEAQNGKIPFFQWHKWIEKRMIEIYQEKKKAKKAQLKGTFFDPKSWFGKVKISSSQQNIQVIEDHFQTI